MQVFSSRILEIENSFKQKYFFFFLHVPSEFKVNRNFQLISSETGVASAINVTIFYLSWAKMRFVGYFH